MSNDETPKLEGAVERTDDYKWPDGVPWTGWRRCMVDGGRESYVLMPGSETWVTRANATGLETGWAPVSSDELGDLVDHLSRHLDERDKRYADAIATAADASVNDCQLLDTALELAAGLIEAPSPGAATQLAKIVLLQQERRVEKRTKPGTDPATAADHVLGRFPDESHSSAAICARHVKATEEHRRVVAAALDQPWDASWDLLLSLLIGDVRMWTQDPTPSPHTAMGGRPEDNLRPIKMGDGRTLLVTPDGRTMAELTESELEPMGTVSIPIDHPREPLPIQVMPQPQPGDQFEIAPRVAVEDGPDYIPSPVPPGSWRGLPPKRVGDVSVEVVGIRGADGVDRFDLDVAGHLGLRRGEQMRRPMPEAQRMAQSRAADRFDVAAFARGATRGIESGYDWLRRIEALQPGDNCEVWWRTWTPATVRHNGAGYYWTCELVEVDRMITVTIEIERIRCVGQVEAWPGREGTP